MTQMQQKLNQFQQGAVSAVYFVLKVSFSVAIGFLTSKCYLLNDFSPFSLILISLSARIGMVISGCYIGSCIGYLSNSIDLNAFKYITALTMIYAVQMIFRKSERKEDYSILSGAACFISGFLFLLAGNLTLFNVLLLAGESVLISCCIFFSDYAVRGFKSKKTLSSRELIAAAVTMMLVLSSLHNTNFFGLNLSRILALLCLFLAISCLKTSHIALLGSCLGIFMSVIGNGGEAIFTAFIVSTLSACVFLNFSSRFANVIFMIVYYVVLFFFEKFPWNYWYFTEPFIAFGIVAAMPKKKLKEILENYIPLRSERAPSKAPVDLRQDLKSFCKASCPHYKWCRTENDEEMQSLFEKLEKTSDYDPENIEKDIPFCKKKEMLTGFIKEKIATLDQEELNDIANQLNSLTKKLEDQALSGVHPVQFLEQEENELKKSLTERNLRVKEINFIVDEQKIKRCDLQIEAADDLMADRIIEDCLKPHFEKKPTIKYQRKDDTIYVHIIENEGFQIHCAALCKTKKGEKFCGDNALGFSSGKNKYCLVLTDGMGSGKNACIHSTLAIDTIRKLTAGGLNVLQSMNIFRSIHRLSNDAVFTTVDICEIDQQTGMLSFYKAGAFDSYCVSGDQLSVIKGGGMPMGLCERDKIRHCTLQIEDGDFIIMSTDGLSSLNDRIESAILESKNEDPKRFAEQILRKLSAISSPSDDVTVMVCKFNKDPE